MRFVFLNGPNAAHRIHSSNTNGGSSNIGNPAATSACPAATPKDGGCSMGFRIWGMEWGIGGDTYLPQPQRMLP